MVEGGYRIIQDDSAIIVIRTQFSQKAGERDGCPLAFTKYRLGIAQRGSFDGYLVENLAFAARLPFDAEPSSIQADVFEIIKHLGLERVGNESLLEFARFQGNLVRRDLVSRRFFSFGQLQASANERGLKRDFDSI